MFQGTFFLALFAIARRLGLLHRILRELHQIERAGKVAIREILRGLRCHLFGLAEPG